ncbi:grasp-with-spasm system ATP-grasp peptide maturase [Chitinophaga nivalis]|uniref:Grasp-with-spasm system ATP-grasp peptide maturase n=1 Tax=Chitinophaga nivalis TaxID=2991709 RepID=A0ABT3IMQ7_9BACT|nr:grasp-with-spasm system ATP-grasp peptide maturase [Chitinophaga nivalis]MCW3465061.1 grasp-with-spasm system ATP-grasp peptide maturase [Chitinophaga nivalis]MCW3485247.1 grasp-with-spasm system ATP-grasp peptide maturase [Chitinophaga nivalis]
MILIFSETGDNVTDKVMDYLYTYHCHCCRINTEDIIKDISYLNNHYAITFLNGKQVTLSDVTSVWYRRGYMRMPELSSQPGKIPADVLLNVSEDWHMLTHHLFYHLSAKTTGSYEKELEQNKLIDLEIAQACALKTPAYIFTSAKKEIIAFLRQKKKIITKSLNRHTQVKSHRHTFETAGTHLIDEQLLYQLPETIFPSFFQEYVEKEIELRIFYIHEKIFTVAIFSQADEQTKIDFRNYNTEKPNRVIPYQIPAAVADSVRRFMQRKELNTGSIDMILSAAGEYVFLEVNPSGQFEWISNACNLYLEKEIATYLRY